MKNKGKVLALMLSAAALVAASVFGTMAYLTDEEAVTNTFTVGQVGLKLDEADVNPDGTYVKDKNTRVQENEYHLLPGYTYIKDPTIHVSEESEECYLFVKVENGIEAIETKDTNKKTIAKQMEELGWVEIDSTNNIYVLAKGEGDAKFQYTVFAGAEVVVFNEFTIDGDSVVYVPKNEKVPDGKVNLANYTTKENQKSKVIVTAYAVQAVGFENSKDAWDATFGK